MAIRTIITSSLFLLCFLGISACYEDDKATLPAELPADFVTFYEQFHKDSAFQMSHIPFPIEGLPPEVDSLTLATGTFRWTAEQWTLHRSFSEESDFTRTFIIYNDRMILEKIVHKNGQLGMARRWAKIGDRWQLIYYAALNRVRRD